MRHFHESKLSITFDLHVLSTPPAFVLSQDQTLQFYITETFYSVHSLLTYFLINLLFVCYSVFKDQLFILVRRFGRKGKITNLHPGVNLFIALVQFSVRPLRPFPSQGIVAAGAVYTGNPVSLSRALFKESAP